MNNINLIPESAIWGFVCASIYILYTLTKIPDIKNKMPEIKDEYGVIFPSLFFLIAPFLFTHIAQNTNDFSSILRMIIPIMTFIFGQFLTEKRYERDLKNKYYNLMRKICDDLLKNHELVEENRNKLNDKPENLELRYLYSIKKDYYQLDEIQENIYRQDKIEIKNSIIYDLEAISIAIEEFNKVNSNFKENSKTNVRIMVFKDDCREQFSTFEEYYEKIRDNKLKYKI